MHSHLALHLLLLFVMVRLSLSQGRRLRALRDKERARELSKP
jgi:hypothetical protein